MNTVPHVVILGGGPAGCGAAYRLRKLDKARVTLVERGGAVGGNAGSFEWSDQWLDFGSHRLHYTTAPHVLADIRNLLGDDLLARKRNGRIRLRGRYVRFPFSPLDLLSSLDKPFAAGVVRDMLLAKLRHRNDDPSFGGVLLRSLGPTICHDFYFPYARKIWGHEPSDLSGIQAQRRVTANSFTKLLRRVVKPVGKGLFHYPRRGFGQITASYAEAAIREGADVLLGTGVQRLVPPSASEDQWCVHVEGPDGPRMLKADYVWSTIPITTLVRMTDGAPEPLIGPAPGIEFRAMLLIYLRLDVNQFTSTDAHYFPESGIGITRLSEPKNYSGINSPAGSTVLCAELPCSTQDPAWSMSDRELGELVVRDIRTAGLPLTRPPVATLVRRLQHAYPIYLSGYERHFDAHDSWAGSQTRLLTFGRQGLFAHDNTHHALYMAYCAVDCLTGTGFDAARWAGFRQEFATHVVED